MDDAQAAPSDSRPWEQADLKDRIAELRRVVYNLDRTDRVLEECNAWMRMYYSTNDARLVAVDERDQLKAAVERVRKMVEREAFATELDETVVPVSELLAALEQPKEGA